MTISKNKIRSWGIALCFVVGSLPPDQIETWKWAWAIIIYMIGWFLIAPLVKKADFIDR